MGIGNPNPTCPSTRKTRSATSGSQKPTTPYERWLLDLEKLQAFIKTQSCQELFDREHDRDELACCWCLNHRYYLPGAKQNFTKEELNGMLVGYCAGTGYSKEKVDLPEGVGPLVDKAGTRTTGCERLQQSREQFAILEMLRQRIEKAEWAKIQQGEGN